MINTCLISTNHQKLIYFARLQHGFSILHSDTTTGIPLNSPNIKFPYPDSC
jgi:hypothetical protein